MRRRQFITLLGGAAAAWPFTARAQQPAMPVIGLLGGGSALGYAGQALALRLGLRDAGFVEGQNLTIESRWADGRNDRLPALAVDLVQRRVEVIVVAGGTATVLAAKAATMTIPIVFMVGGDPVRSGLVTSFNRPGGNVTGVVSFSEALIIKRLEIIRELVPKAGVIGILLNPGNANAEIRSTEVMAAARTIGQEIRILNANNEDQIGAVFAILAQERIGALVVQNDPLFNDDRERLTALATKNAVATIYEYRESAAAGGLISYGASQQDSYRQAGIYAGRILKGEKAADLPVVRPTKLDLVINLKTAKALGLTIPEALLLRADEVIE